MPTWPRATRARPSASSFGTGTCSAPSSAWLRPSRWIGCSKGSRSVSGRPAGAESEPGLQDRDDVRLRLVASRLEDLAGPVGRDGPPDLVLAGVRQELAQVGGPGGFVSEVGGIAKRVELPDPDRELPALGPGHVPLQPCQALG